MPNLGDVWGSAGAEPHIFNLITIQRYRCASYPGCFIAREIAPSTYWIGDCVDLRASLVVVTKKKSLLFSGIQPQLFSP
jgi:hypothetical protein